MGDSPVAGPWLRIAALAGLVSALLLSLAAPANAVTCVNASSGEAMTCGDAGAVSKQVFEESPAADDQTTTTDVDGQPESDGSGAGIVIAVFVGTLAIAGVVFAVIRSRRKGVTVGDEVDDEDDYDDDRLEPTGPSQSSEGPSFLSYALVAFASAIIGAGLASGATLLIAERGPEGAQGEPGAQGPKGEPGDTPEVDTSDLDSRVGSLENAVDDISGGYDVPTNQTVVDDLEELSDAVTDLQDQVEVICDTLSGDYLTGSCFFIAPTIRSTASR